MTIKLSKPYKVSPRRIKRYEQHYQMPAQYSLVVPVKLLGDEALCDVRWEDVNGELHWLQHKVFAGESLVPLDPLMDNKLNDLWKMYYGDSKNEEKSFLNTFDR